MVATVANANFDTGDHANGDKLSVRITFCFLFFFNIETIYLIYSDVPALLS